MYECRRIPESFFVLPRRTLTSRHNQSCNVIVIYIVDNICIKSRWNPGKFLTLYARFVSIQLLRSGSFVVVFSFGRQEKLKQFCGVCRQSYLTPWRLSREMGKAEEPSKETSEYIGSFFAAKTQKAQKVQKVFNQVLIPPLIYQKLCGWASFMYIITPTALMLVSC